MVNLEKYRDKWIFENIDNAIGFYTREFYCLDNFSAFKVFYNGVLYSTIEHAYQANKFINTAPDVAKQIIDSYSPYDAQRIATLNKEKQDANWNNVKLKIMEELLRLKIEQNPHVKDKLLRTKDYTIVEDSPVDTFWGIGKDRTGRNELGKLWMKLRDEEKN